MNDALPGEVIVTELPDGVRYRLPRRKGGRLALHFAAGLLGCLIAIPFLSFWLLIVGSSIDWKDILRDQNGLLLIFMAVGLWMFLMALWLGVRGLFLFAAHCEIELRGGVLHGIERLGWLRRSWRRPVAGLRRFDIRDAMLAKDPTRVYESAAAAVEHNTIVPVWDTDESSEETKAKRLAPGYPRAWLLPLASDLARRCQLGAVEHAGMSTPIEVAEEPLPNSAGFVDLVEQPSESEIVVLQHPEEMTVTVPWRCRNVVLTVAGDELAVRRPKLFGAEQHHWSRRQLADIRVGRMIYSEGPDTFRLHIQPYPGEGKGFCLPLADEAEARWLATLLRAALRLQEVSRPDEFLEREQQPADSRIVWQESAEGVTLTVPPAGFAHSDVRSRLLCSIISLAAAALFGAVLSFLFKVGVIGLLSAGVGGSLAIAFLVDAVSRSRRQAVLSVSGDRLLVQQSSLYGVRSEEWPRLRLADVRIGDTLEGKVANAYIRQSARDQAEATYELQIHLRNGEIVRFLDGYGDAELQWLATVLRRTLRLPQENSAP
jgi:hypothetical protein